MNCLFCLCTVYIRVIEQDTIDRSRSHPVFASEYFRLSTYTCDWLGQNKRHVSSCLCCRNESECFRQIQVNSCFFRSFFSTYLLYER
jgi:hypothetical protein